MISVLAFLMFLAIALVSFLYLNDTHKGLPQYEKTFGFSLLRWSVLLLALSSGMIGGTRLFSEFQADAAGLIYSTCGLGIVSGLLLTHRRYVNSKTD